MPSLFPLLGSRIFPETRSDEARRVPPVERSTRASEECSLWPNISVNFDGEPTHSACLRALNCRLCHRNALCLKIPLSLAVFFPSLRLRLLIKLGAAARGLPLWLDGALVSLSLSLSVRASPSAACFILVELCSRFVLMLHCIHAIVLLVLFAETIVDTILTATKTFGLRPELDR